MINSIIFSFFNTSTNKTRKYQKLYYVYLVIKIEKYNWKYIDRFLPIDNFILNVRCKLNMYNLSIPFTYAENKL